MKRTKIGVQEITDYGSQDPCHLPNPFYRPRVPPHPSFTYKRITLVRLLVEKFLHCPPTWSDSARCLGVLRPVQERSKPGEKRSRHVTLPHRPGPLVFPGRHSPTGTRPSGPVLGLHLLPPHPDGNFSGGVSPSHPSSDPIPSWTGREERRTVHCRGGEGLVPFRLTALPTSRSDSRSRGTVETY